MARTHRFFKDKKEVDFVILREGYRKQRNPMFLEYVKGCKENDIPIHAVYHFCYAADQQRWAEEAQSCISNVEKAGLGKDIIIFFDFEYDTVKKAADQGVKLGKPECIAFARASGNYIESKGYTAGVYVNMDYYKNMYDEETMRRYKFWLADYSESSGCEMPLSSVYQFRKSIRNRRQRRYELLL